MQNAHERFGSLEFVRHTKDATTRVHVRVDRVILEPSKQLRDQSSAHLLSFVGRDSEIGALWAGISEGATFQLLMPDQRQLAISLGAEAQCFRGSLAFSNRERPFRHLVAISQEFSKTKAGADQQGTRTILFSDDPRFVLYRIANRYGLPVVPEWASWFMGELRQRKATRPLLGWGCSPVLVNGNKSTFLKWIGQALEHGSIKIPQRSGPVHWNLPPTFLDQVVASNSPVSPQAQ